MRVSELFSMFWVSNYRFRLSLPVNLTTKPGQIPVYFFGKTN